MGGFFDQYEKDANGRLIPKTGPTTLYTPGRVMPSRQPTTDNRVTAFDKNLLQPVDTGNSLASTAPLAGTVNSQPTTNNQQPSTVNRVLASTTTGTQLAPSQQQPSAQLATGRAARKTGAGLALPAVPDFQLPEPKITGQTLANAATTVPTAAQEQLSARTQAATPVGYIYDGKNYTANTTDKSLGAITEDQAGALAKRWNVAPLAGPTVAAAGGEDQTVQVIRGTNKDKEFFGPNAATNNLAYMKSPEYTMNQIDKYKNNPYALKAVTDSTENFASGAKLNTSLGQLYTGTANLKGTEAEIAAGIPKAKVGLLKAQTADQYAGASEKGERTRGYKQQNDYFAKNGVAPEDVAKQQEQQRKQAGDNKKSFENLQKSFFGANVGGKSLNYGQATEAAAYHTIAQRGGSALQVNGETYLVDDNAVAAAVKNLGGKPSQQQLTAYLTRALPELRRTGGAAHTFYKDVLPKGQQYQSDISAE